MYSNGGYLMLDFKGSVITSTPTTYDGISYNDIIRSDKPIILCNAKLSNIECKVSTCNVIMESGGNIVLSILGYGILFNISITKNNMVTLSYISLNTNTLNIESEVSTNASKSDSNISK